MQEKAYLVLEDGSVFPGRGFGGKAPRVSDLGGDRPEPSGEVVFNTGMTGYHEILTDPSYTGQLVAMTYPHIGNYGTAAEWGESGPEPASRKGVKAAGFILRSLYDGPLPAGRLPLAGFLASQGICGIEKVDTRRLTLHLREKGSCNGLILRAEDSRQGWTSAEAEKALTFLRAQPSMEGRNLVGRVGAAEAVSYPGEGPHVALLDCGMKAGILRELQARGCRVTLLPSDSSPEDLRRLAPQGLFLSNGPGDPAVLDGQIALAEAALGRYPLVGICLGHQILGRALGAETYKMKFGHHGSNHPVRDEETGRVFVTSQNHGFALDEASLPAGAAVRFRNANDGSVEGVEWREKSLLCVQFHPEAAPGPRDASWIFDAFLATIKEK